MLGQNSDAPYSSPMQTPGTTWRTTAGSISGGYRWAAAIKTDGTLWMGDLDRILWRIRS